MQNYIPHIGIVSLGCAKNLVDTQRLSSVLVAKGYIIENDYSKCDLVVVNTCGFINPAIEESLDTIGEALQYAKKVIVMGCLGTNEKLVLSKYPQVHKVFGPSVRASVVREIVKVVGEPPQDAVQKLNPSGILLTPPHYAYLKISEGCRHRCSFCIIPKLRGTQRSRDVDNIFLEAQDLVSRGVKELLIIAQDSSDYGFDLETKPNLYGLLDKLSTLNKWIRVHYVYPSKEADRIIDLMAEDKVLPYIDVPFQHANLDILKAMRRPGSMEKTIQTIERWRNIRPDIAIRSTFITGFPSESRSQFEELLDFIKEARLDRVGCFPYSEVDGADANNIGNFVDKEEREARAFELMEIQEQISFEKLQTRIGKQYDVIVDDVTDEGVAIARSKYEAPDVDGQIFIEDVKGVRAGDIIKVEITNADEHDMQAKLVKTLVSPINFKNIK